MGVLGITAMNYGITDISLGTILRYLGITYSETKWYEIGTRTKK